MAKIIGGLATSHIPAIGGAIAKGLQQDPYWKPFFDGFGPARAWLKREKPDVAIIFYNDHGLNFFLDKMPTFAVGAADEYRNDDEGWGIPTLPPFKGDAELSWHDHQSSDRAGIRRRHLSGNACRPRLHDPAKAVLARGRRSARHSRLHQYRAVPAAEREALRGVRQGDRGGRAGLGRR